MAPFRFLLIVMFGLLLAYTGVVMIHHGPSLFQVFFGDMAKLGWPGQFNLDFMMMLMFSGLWVAWRHRFSARGLGLAVLAFFLGSAFLCVYLFILTLQTKGDMREILVGKARV